MNLTTEFQFLQPMWLLLLAPLWLLLWRYTATGKSRIHVATNL